MKPKVSEWEKELKQIITDIAYSAGDCYEDLDNPYVTEYLPKLQSLLDQQKAEIVEMVRGLDWKFVSGNEGDTNNPFSDENKWVRRDDIINKLEV